MPSKIMQNKAVRHFTYPFLPYLLNGLASGNYVLNCILFTLSCCIFAFDDGVSNLLYCEEHFTLPDLVPSQLFCCFTILVFLFDILLENLQSLLWGRMFIASSTGSNPWSLFGSCSCCSSWRDGSSHPWSSLHKLEWSLSRARWRGQRKILLHTYGIYLFMIVWNMWF